MLTGMGLECSFKALWLKHGNVLVKDGRYVGIPGANDHDLVQLAIAVGFAVDAHETHLLTRLSAFIMYGGRYPVPVHAQELALIKHPGGGKGMKTTWSNADDAPLAAILGRLTAQLS